MKQREALGRHSRHKVEECGTINDGGVPEEHLNTCRGLAVLLNWRRLGQAGCKEMEKQRNKGGKSNITQPRFY